VKAYQMSVSDTGVNLVKKWEGCYLKAYQDVVGVWTIGYGHTKGVYRGQVLSGEREAHNILKEDLNSHMGLPNQDITGELNQNQYDALCSFAFNLGAGIFRNNQNLLDAINSGDWQEAGRIMKLFNKAGGRFYQGLQNRRNEEVELMLSNVSCETIVDSGYDDSWFTSQDGTFTLDRTINLRTRPRDGEVIATLNVGDSVTYDKYGYEADGYVWIRQPRENGYAYIATGETVDGKRVSYWGSFE